ncbi:hypothetical protein PROFUN_06028 [Planoprotostelium fungivorum]|uniref:Succinate dehydrogenase assembly factor 3 n=1 Tax=Planoprotostelium fungivorum TaxID=1890364 RepID=A0A2P6MQL8_9EUKA|nr:hypothetical protein PROFUN_16447 [Planoprotostelium fungivorum]PRP85906.1 hypothetical protein PROFUN_06028 [Planoprotostelium fungivorum]
MQRRMVTTLYRNILKFHREELPSEMRQLGDAYVKSEWQLHRKTNGELLNQFIWKWQDYLNTLQKQSKVTREFGVDLGNEQLSIMTKSQKKQLESLKKEAQSIKKDE